MSAPATNRFDVLGLGCTAVDDVLYVPRFPATDEKVQVQRSSRRFGGLTGAALVAAARLGARCAYAGCLGTDELSDYAAACLEKEGVDLSSAPRLAQGKVVHSVVVVGIEAGTRNVFYEGSGMIGAHATEPKDELVQHARVLFIDQWGMAGNLRAAQIARASGAAVLADFEDATSPLFRQVLPWVDHLILGEKFALEITAEPDPAAAARALWRTDRAAVIVTCGARGGWSVSDRNDLAPTYYPAFVVEATDTTGCGDVFHGAYAASLARGDALDARIEFAAAAAALKARDGETPQLAEVNKFLQSNPDRGATERGISPRTPIAARIARRNRKPLPKP